METNNPKINIFQRPKVRRGIKLVPNLLTTANLFCGFFSITQTLQGKYVFAAWMVILAGFFDGLDGRVARMTQTQSDFGVEYDSLADLTTFCMAPAILMFDWALHPLGKFGIAACFLFFACGALRLARFNVQAWTVEKKHFQGIPTPAAAGWLVSFLIFYRHIFHMAKPPALIVMGMLVMMAFMMVSNVRYRSLKKVKRISFFMLVCVVALIFVVAAQPEIMFFAIGCVYVGLGLVEWLWQTPKHVRSFGDFVQNFFRNKESELELDDLAIQEDDHAEEAQSNEDGKIFEMR